jgi:predicted transcriptional regulator
MPVSAIPEVPMPKLTVQFEGRLEADLDQLAREQGVPKTQIIRRSIALLKYVEDERKKGHRLAITDADDQVIKEIVST